MRWLDSIITYLITSSSYYSSINELPYFCPSKFLSNILRKKKLNNVHAFYAHGVLIAVWEPTTDFHIYSTLSARIICSHLSPYVNFNHCKPLWNKWVVLSYPSGPTLLSLVGPRPQAGARGGQCESKGISGVQNTDTQATMPLELFTFVVSRAKYKCQIMHTFSPLV